MRDLILVDCSVHAFGIHTMFESSDFVKRYGDADPTDYLKCLIAMRLSNPVDFVGYNPDTTEYIYCWDTKIDQPNGTKGYWRHNEFAEYKAGRSRRPETWYLTLRLMKEYCDRHNLVQFAYPGLEADDIIADFCRVYRGVDNVRVTISSVDTDLLQLVGDNIYYAWTYAGQGYARTTRMFNEYHACNYIKYKFKRTISHPSQIADIKSELGDKSDNLAPGADIRLIDLIGNHHGVSLNIDTDTFVGSKPNRVHTNFARKWCGKHLLPGFDMLTTHGE